MKKSHKVISYTFAIIGIAITAVFIVFLITYRSADKIELNEDKLKTTFDNVKVLTADNIEIKNNTKEYQYVTYNDISENAIDAFIAIEDKRFYKHNGVDYLSISRAIWNNIKAFSFKEGASTISQQLVKNTILSNEKTLQRKIYEINLAKRLEKKYSKEEILEMYLSAIYFGHGQYGIKNASWYYFSKSPDKLSIDEAALLAGIVKAPTNYEPINHYDKSISRRDIVLKAMFDNGKISESEYSKAINTTTVLNINENMSSKYYKFAITEAEEILDMTETELQDRGIKIITNQNEKTNSYIKNIGKNLEYKSNIIILDVKKSQVIAAYSSDENGIYKKGNVASTLKPLIAYAPSIDTNTLSPLYYYDDKPINFNGYEPKNFRNLYYGNVSMRKAIEKSLNSTACYTLNAVGIDVARTYLLKMDINLAENEGLSAALGATNNGISPIQLVGGYGTLANDGDYIKPHIINKIIDNNGFILYENKNEKEKVFNSSTTFIMKDMLNSVAKTGTAKKLGKSGLDLSAKTGTYGDDNQNFSSWCIAYDDNYVVLVELYNNLPNNVTGGTKPTELVAKIFNNLGNDFLLEKPNYVEKVSIDKYSLINEKKLLLASKNTPEMWKFNEYIDINYIPTIVSEIFENPSCEPPKLKLLGDMLILSVNTKPIYSYEIKDVITNQIREITGTGDEIEIPINKSNSFSHCFVVTPKLTNNKNIIGQSVLSNVVYDNFDFFE